MVALLSLLLLAGATAALPSATNTSTGNSTARATTDPCTIFRTAIDKQASFSKNGTGTAIVPAEMAYNCLANIPLDVPTSLTAINQLRKYLSFYSASIYWTNPPAPELELEAININATLDAIEAGVKAGAYTNDYAVNKELYDLVMNRWDGHTRFQPVCLAGFIYAHPYELVSIASRPDSLPKIHLATVTLDQSDIIVGPEVMGINGNKPEKYLSWLSGVNSPHGFLDPDTRWNDNFVRRYGSGQLVNGNFARRRIYDPEPIVISLANKTDLTVEWKAYFKPSKVAASIPGPDGTAVHDMNAWNDTDSFYENFCLRSDAETEALFATQDALIASAGSTAAAASSGRVPTIKIPTHELMNHQHRRSSSIEKRGNPALASNWSTTIYMTPYPDLMSYTRLDAETAVLVVAAFENEGDKNSNAFSHVFVQFLTDAIGNSTANGIKKLIIDVSGNGGGQVALGPIFAQLLFPESLNTYATNLHWNPYLFDTYVNGNVSRVADSDDDVKSQMKTPYGYAFSSYEEELARNYRDGDYFTPISYMNGEFTDEVEEVGYNKVKGNSTSPRQPFRTENVVVVSDGWCGSTCTVMTEKLRAVGVKHIAVGGRPREGPMQAIGGVKGGQIMQLDDLLSGQYILTGKGVDTNGDYLSSFKLRLTTDGASINYRNQFRMDGSAMHLPMEFLYMPADYRIFRTAETVDHGKALWEAVADVAWNGAKSMTGGGSYTPIEGIDGAGWSGPILKDTPARTQEKTGIQLVKMLRQNWPGLAKDI